MKRVNRLFRLIASVLVITCLFTSVNVSATVATNSTKATDVFANEQISTNEISNNNKISKIKELTGKRDKFSKTYLMSDGSQKLVVSQHAVHYRKNGEWINVDNSLEQVSKASGTTTYRNNKNYYDVEFSDKVGNSSLVSVKKDGYELSWGLTQETPAPISDIQSNSEKISTASALEIGKKIAQTPVNNLLNVNTEAKLSRATKKSSEIEYNNISNGVDLKYELLSVGFHINIVTVVR